jgi:hypothetical protein
MGIPRESVLHYGQGKNRGNLLTGNRGHPARNPRLLMRGLPRWAIGCIEKSALISRLEVGELQTRPCVGGGFVFSIPANRGQAAAQELALFFRAAFARVAVRSRKQPLKMWGMNAHSCGCTNIKDRCLLS